MDLFEHIADGVTTTPAPAASPQQGGGNDLFSDIASGVQGARPSTPPQMAAPSAQGPRPFNILPFSEDANGKVSFDIHAGLPGAILRAVSAPYDAMTGKFDPMSPEGQQRALETALTISPASTAMRAGERAIPGVMKAMTRDEPKPPSAQALKDAANAQYKAVRETGAEYPGPSIGDLSTGIQSALHDDGFIAELAPKTFAILKKLDNPPEGSVVTISSLDAARKALNRIAPNPQDNTEYEAARRVIERIDDFIQGAGSAPSVAGTPPAGSGAAAYLSGPDGAVAVTPESEAARLIKEARGNAAARFRSDRITGVEDAAELRASAANSGQNLGNTLRQRLASLLLNNKQTRGFSPEELAAMRQIIEGTPVTNTLRYTGNLLGGGGGIGQTAIGALGAGAGAAAAGFPGAAIGGALPPALGAASRAGANALTSRQVRLLDEMIRKRSPLFQEMLQGTPLEVVNPEKRALLMRGLLLAGDNAGQ